MSRVLIIEDDRGATRLLRVLLEADGHEVASEATGSGGLRAAAALAPDLVILDLGLPDMHGTEVLGGLRSWSSVPLLVLSGSAEEPGKAALLDAGADDYLEKPFGATELPARVRALLRRAGQAPPAQPVLHFGDLEVDLAGRRVTLRDRPVRLTPIEFRLLHEFVTHPGKLQTQEWLTQRIWGAGRVGASDYLRVYVRNLRRKLGDDARKPTYIETQPRIGYRWLHDTKRG